MLLRTTLFETVWADYISARMLLYATDGCFMQHPI